MDSRFYELLGRATWAVGKRQVKRKVKTAPSVARYVAVGALAVGVIGLGALVARTNGGE